jgi:hypothetical protein
LLPGEQSQQGRFARAVAADDADPVAGVDAQGQRSEERAGGVLDVDALSPEEVGHDTMVPSPSRRGEPAHAGCFREMGTVYQRLPRPRRRRECRRRLVSPGWEYPHPRDRGQLRLLEFRPAPPPKPIDGRPDARHDPDWLG